MSRKTLKHVFNDLKMEDKELVNIPVEKIVKEYKCHSSNAHVLYICEKSLIK